MAEDLRPVSPDEVAIGYNPENVAGKAVVFWAVGIIVFLVVCFGLIQTYWIWFKEREYDRKVQQPVSEDIRALRAREDGELTRYRWIDKGKGTVGLPVERAMELVARGYASGQLTYAAKPGNKAQIDAANAGVAAVAADGGASAGAASTPNASPRQ
jgi:hypothetical protein